MKDDKLRSNVIEFPTRIARKWAEFEKFITDALEQQYAATAEMTNEICRRMKGFWKKLDTDISLSVPIAAGMDEDSQKAFDDSLQRMKESLAS